VVGSRLPRVLALELEGLQVRGDQSGGRLKVERGHREHLGQRGLLTLVERVLATLRRRMAVVHTGVQVGSSGHLVS
jgi:hypothetical protein